VRLVTNILGGVLCLAVLAAGWDFLSFVDRAENSLSAETPAQADAVTALTGGADARIAEGVQLAEQLGAPLLISGVHIDTTAADIAQIAGVDEGRITCCVTLGRAAATTKGNGAEVADWARRQRVTSIIVVTSEYHMDRALMELRRAMPEGEFTPHAVATLSSRPRDWWRSPSLAQRLVGEWLKFRVASLQAGPSAAERSAAMERSTAG
jgi:uncharacterized SAM-binding protein YcdF (DUF218 family)